MSTDHSHIIHLPGPFRLIADIARNLGEAVVIPGALFYTVLVTIGLNYALVAALCWAYAAVGVRLVRRVRPPALLLAGTALATVQVTITMVADSAKVYFLQPTLTTYLFGMALLATVPLEQPLIQRLANDFLPLPSHVLDSLAIRRLFQRLSVLWAGVLLFNASLTLGLLLTRSAEASMPVTWAVSVPVFGIALTASYRWFRKSLDAGGFELTWGSPESLG